MTLRVVLAACLALILALGVRWMIPTDRATGLPDSMPDTRFDYTLTDYSARFRDADDRLELELSGPRLEHISATRVALLEQPQFHIEPDGAGWQGQANQGRIQRGDEVLVLEHDVELRRPHPDGEIIVLAEILQHDRGLRTITSNRPVEFRQAGSRLHAGGLVIRLDNNSIELTNHVQGEIQPAVFDRNTDAGIGDDDSR